MSDQVTRLEAEVHKLRAQCKARRTKHLTLCARVEYALTLLRQSRVATHRSRVDELTGEAIAFLELP